MEKPGKIVTSRKLLSRAELDIMDGKDQLPA
jgi:hypothetical protein